MMGRGQDRNTFGHIHQSQSELAVGEGPLEAEIWRDKREIGNVRDLHQGERWLS
jgi:hypothetical protein